MVKYIISFRIRGKLLKEIEEIKKFQDFNRTEILEKLLEDGLKNNRIKEKAKWLSYALIIFTITYFAFQLPMLLTM